MTIAPPRRAIASQLPIVDFLYRHGQSHVFRWWETMSDPERAELLRHLSEIPVEPLNELLERFAEWKRERPTNSRLDFQPMPMIALPLSEDDRRRDAQAAEFGLEALRRGEVAVYLVAGGQGSRLEFDGPKGLYPITPILGKSLFQLFTEKLLALEQRIGRSLPWILMTSHDNHKATVEFFEQSAYFGRDPGSLFFVTQDMWPSLSLDGRFLMTAPNRLAMNPNGHGGSLFALHESGLIGRLLGRGVRHLFYFQVDNPLVRLADPVFLGHHLRHGSQVSTKVVAKTDPAEKVGVLGVVDGRPSVIEYSDLPPELAGQRGPDGRLCFGAGNTAIHAFALEFIDRLTDHGLSLPIHAARKKISHLDGEGRWIDPDEPNGVKLEMFVFDALSLADRALAVEVDRDREFAPVKNARGPDSPSESRRRMHALHMSWVRRAGYAGPEPARVEIDPRFADDEPAFLARATGIDWKALEKRTDWVLGEPSARGE